MRDLTFTLYPSKAEPKDQVTGVPTTLPWAAWLERWAVHEVRASKDGSAVVLGPVAGRRLRANVSGVDALALDLEHLTDADLEDTLQILSPYEWVAWTTHSSRPEEMRLRVVLPLVAFLPAVDQPQAWLRLNQMVKGHNDPATKDASRLHYEPAVPPERADTARVLHNPGNWLAVEDLPPLSRSVTNLLAERSAVEAAVAESELRTVRNALSSLRQTDPLADAGFRLVRGECFAEPRERHKAVLALTMWLAGRRPPPSPGVVELLFTPSLAAHEAATPGDAPTIAEVLVAYEGALRVREERRQEAARAAQHGEAGAYSEDELARIAAAQGCGVEDLRRRWILQRDGAAWFLGADGHYTGPYTKDDIAPQMSAVLRRAPIQLLETTQNGVRYRSVLEVVRDFGQVAEKVEACLVSQHHRYDSETRTMFEAARPLRRDLVPQYDEQIAEWLRILAGSEDRAAQLVDWLSCAPHLDRLLCALYLDGAPAAGKTILANGLAHLWTTGSPTDISNVLGNFTEDWARCPLALADEEVPTSWGRITSTTQLRQMIGQTQRQLNRKYRAGASLNGCIRLVLAANNARLLTHGGVSSGNDVRAIAERFLYLKAPKTAADFLVEVGRETVAQWGATGIARHVLWLSQNHPVRNPGKRFWVQGDESTITRLMIIYSKWNALALEWLTRYCLQPQPVDSGAQGLVRRGDGRLLVNAQALVDHWETYLKGRIDPETSKIGAALNQLSHDRKEVVPTNGKRVTYRVVDIDYVLAWSEENGIGDPQTILAACGASAPPPPVGNQLETFPALGDGGEEAPF